jgi:RimJ/RimL family protein N-acetyltransferase
MGKGYGAAAIRAGADHALTVEHVCRVVARVRRDNPASVAAFSRAGFALRGYVRTGNIEACEMIRDVNG